MTESEANNLCEHHRKQADPENSVENSAKDRVIEELLKDVDWLKCRNKSIWDEMCVLGYENKKLAKEKKEVELELEIVSERYAACISENEELKKHASTHNEGVQNLHGIIVSGKVDNERLTRENGDLRGLTAKLKAENEKLKAELQEKTCNSSVFINADELMGMLGNNRRIFISGFNISTNMGIEVSGCIVEDKKTTKAQPQAQEKPKCSTCGGTKQHYKHNRMTGGKDLVNWCPECDCETCHGTKIKDFVIRLVDPRGGVYDRTYREEVQKDCPDCAPDSKTDIGGEIEKIHDNFMSAVVDKLHSESELDTLIYILQDFILNPHKKAFKSKDFAANLLEKLTKRLPNS